MTDVEKTNAKILNKIFFDQDDVEKKISDKEKFKEYLKKHLKEELKLHCIAKPVFEEIKDDFIHGGLSFYDHYHNEWISDYIFELGKPGKAEYPENVKTIMKFYQDKKACFIPMTELIIEHRSHHRSPNEDNQSTHYGSCMLHIVEGNISYKKYNVGRPGFNDCNDIASISSSDTTSCCTKNGKLPLCADLSNYKINLKEENIVKLIGDLDITEPENKEKLCNLFRFFRYQRHELGLKCLYCFTPTSVVPAGIIFLNLKDKLSDECINFFQTLSNQLFLQLSLARLSRFPQAKFFI